MLKNFYIWFCLILAKSVNSFNVKTPNVKSMNFNLNKDSLWISFPINNNYHSKINELIPNTHTLAKSKIFEEDLLEYRIFFNIFEVNTPFFKGDRLEVVTLAQEKITEDISFVVIDCFTNAMHWDPINGIQQSNCKFDKLINNNKYNIKINNNKNKPIFDLQSDKGKIRKSVLKSFSIYPNYKCFFKNFTTGYTLTFNEKQIDKKVLLINNYNLEHDIYKDYIKELEHIFIYTNRMNFKVYL
jgi:hypothetical protein